MHMHKVHAFTPARFTFSPGSEVAELISGCTNTLIPISLAVYVYSDCEEDKTLWTTLHLNEVLNLEEILNVSKVGCSPFVIVQNK